MDQKKAFSGRFFCATLTGAADIGSVWDCGYCGENPTFNKRKVKNKSGNQFNVEGNSEFALLVKILNLLLVYLNAAGCAEFRAFI